MILWINSACLFSCFPSAYWSRLGCKIAIICENNDDVQNCICFDTFLATESNIYYECANYRLFIQASSSSFAAAVFWNLLKTGNHWKHFSHQCTMGKFTSGGRPWKWAFLATDSNIYYECANFRLFIQASSSFAAAVFWNLLKTGNHWKYFSHQCTVGKCTCNG